MDEQEMKGRWTQLRGRAKQRWSRLTDDDLDRIQGREQELVGRIQERYGKGREQAALEVEGWLDELDASIRPLEREIPISRR